MSTNIRSFVFNNKKKERQCDIHLLLYISTAAVWQCFVFIRAASGSFAQVREYIQPISVQDDC